MARNLTEQPPEADSNLCLGVDLGGTKIEIVALDRATGTLRWNRRVATPQGDYNATLDTIVDLVQQAERACGARASLGVGTPGALSRATGCLKNSNSVCLNDRPIRQDLEDRLARPVRIANDANCFALSEATDGAAADAGVVFGVILGTGTGAGIVVERRILTGPNAVAGEWGHNPLPWPRDEERPGPACYCGRYGCIETFVSGPGMQQDHRREAGIELAPPAIVAAAEQGDPVCGRTLERYADRLARSLAHVINLLDPDAIVLGGGMGNIDYLYTAVPQRWGDYVFSDRIDTRLLQPVYGDASGVRGAAWLGAG